MSNAEMLAHVVSPLISDGKAVLIVVASISPTDAQGQRLLAWEAATVLSTTDDSEDELFTHALRMAAANWASGGQSQEESA